MKSTNKYLDNSEVLEFWNGHVKKWRDSGLGKAEYCRREQLRYYAFFYWQKKINNNSSSKLTTQSIKLVKLEMPKTPINSAISDERASGIQLETKDFRVNLAKGFDQMTLLRVLKVSKELVCG